MVEMIFRESLSIFQLLIITTLTAIGIFIWAFYRQIRSYLKDLTQSPSIVVCGPKGCGKTSMVKWLTGGEVLSNPIEDHLNVGYLEDGNKKIQIIDGVAIKNIEQLKKLNCRSIIYIFDPSPNSDPVNEQIKDFERVKKTFKNIEILPFINKIDVANRKKLNEIESKVKNFYKISIKTADGLDGLKKNILSAVIKI